MSYVCRMVCDCHSDSYVVCVSTVIEHTSPSLVPAISITLLGSEVFMHHGDGSDPLAVRMIDCAHKPRPRASRHRATSVDATAADTPRSGDSDGSSHRGSTAGWFPQVPHRRVESISKCSLNFGRARRRCPAASSPAQLIPPSLRASPFWVEGPSPFSSLSWPHRPRLR